MLFASAFCVAGLRGAVSDGREQANELFSSFERLALSSMHVDLLNLAATGSDRTKGIGTTVILPS